jgi:hypothetical protein
MKRIRNSFPAVTGLLVFAAILFIAGPAFAGGISEEAAIVIAKGYMIDNGYDQDYVLFWPSVTDDYNYKKSWHVTFPPTVTSFLAGNFAFSVDIDKETGNVLGASARD